MAVTDAVALLSARLVAVMVTTVPTGTPAGAVNRPELEMEPWLADQSTALSSTPSTVAAYCWLLPGATHTSPGRTMTSAADRISRIASRGSVLVARRPVVAVCRTRTTSGSRPRSAGAV